MKRIDGAEYWTEEEEKRLTELYAGSSMAKLLEAFPGRSRHSVLRKAQKLRIKKAVPIWAGQTPEEPLTLGGFDLGFVVGMLEGEGCIGAYRRNTCVNIKVFWVNTKWELLWELQKLLNGWGVIYDHNIPSGNRVQSYTLLITRYGQVREILKVVEPFLIGKKKQAQLALEYLDSRMDKPKSPIHVSGKLIGSKVWGMTERDVQIVDEMHRLNHRGLKETSTTTTE